MRIFILNHLHNMYMGLEEISFIYLLKLYVKGRCFFCTNTCSLQQIFEFPYTTKGASEVTIIIFGNLSCDAR